MRAVKLDDGWAVDEVGVRKPLAAGMVAKDGFGVVNSWESLLGDALSVGVAETLFLQD